MSAVQDQNIIKISATSGVTPPPHARNHVNSSMFQLVLVVKHVKLAAQNGMIFVRHKKIVWERMTILVI